jgi:hypothetical protein
MDTTEGLPFSATLIKASLKSCLEGMASRKVIKINEAAVCVYFIQVSLVKKV